MNESQDLSSDHSPILLTLSVNVIHHESSQVLVSSLRD